LNRLQQIGALTAGPIVVTTTTESSTTSSSSSSSSSFVTTVTKHSYHQHPTTTTATPTHPMVQQTAQHLTQVYKHSISLRLALQGALQLTQDLSQRHAALLKHSGELSAAADRLQQEETLLTAHAEDIGRPLQHYNAIDHIATQLGVLFKEKTTVRGLPKIKVDDEEDDFKQLLDSLDAAVDYFLHQMSLTTTSDHKNSGHAVYYKRAVQLQEAATALIQEAVADRMVHLAQQIMKQAKPLTNADQLEASLIYTRFHGISSRSRKILQHILHRTSPIYQDTLQQCRNTFCAQRQALLLPSLRQHMDRLHQEHGTAAMTRLASVYLIHFCTMETSLYEDFFGDSSRDATFPNHLATLCSSSMHRTIRRALVVELDLDTLCQMVAVLKEERKTAATTALAAARALTEILADAQERLIYCAHQALQKQVVRFKATPMDLNYPEKLVAPNATTAQDTTTTTFEQQLEQQFESWFPPVRSVLQILSKIFRVVEPGVFEDLALTSVQAACASLQQAANYLQKRADGTLHGDLFLIQHFLILREQLSPFDLELRSVERQLDFSQTGKAVRSFLQNRQRIFQRQDNGLVQLLRDGVSVQEASLDSKRDLEEALRKTCHAFIDHICERVAPGLVVSGSVNGLVPEKMEQEWAHVTTQMALYLKNPGTMSILLKPILRKLTKAAQEVKGKLLTDDNIDDAQKASVLAIEETIQKLKSTK
jgi:hypothetical protein